MPQAVPEKWIDEDIARLRSAYRRGGKRAALAEFPNRSLGSVCAALRRFANMESVGVSPPIEIDGAAVRARLRSLPHDVFVDGLADLLMRSALYEGLEA